METSTPLIISPSFGYIVPLSPTLCPSGAAENGVSALTGVLSTFTLSVYLNSLLIIAQVSTLVVLSFGFYPLPVPANKPIPYAVLMYV